MPVTTTFEEFRQDALARGCDEVLVREWPAGKVVAQHTHPFSARALMVRGEMWLRIGSEQARHLRAGDTFEVEGARPHDERYGAEGVTLWVARTH